jgi:hypothetical protein
MYPRTLISFDDNVHVIIVSPCVIEIHPNPSPRLTRGDRGSGLKSGAVMPTIEGVEEGLSVSGPARKSLRRTKMGMPAPGQRSYS